MFQSSLGENLDEIDDEDDLDQEPGEDEIREYAELIGIDAKTEPELLWIARAGITAPLPGDWKPIQVNNGDELYFYNFKTGESSWEHPSDEKYRQLVTDERKKIQHKPKAATSAAIPAVNKSVGKPPVSATTASQSSSAAAAAAAATAALKPLKHAPPLPPSTSGTIGKLAPIGAQSGKLQPISAVLPPATPPKPPVGKSLAPIGHQASLERPKTSRGPTEKENPPHAEQPPPPSRKPPVAPPTVLGGGSRFLKKADDPPAPSTTDGQRAIVQNVLQFPSDESDSDSTSSLQSAPLSIPGVDKENLLLDLDELKPVNNPKQAAPTMQSAKPPVAPKISPPSVQPEKAQVMPEPAKPPIAPAPSAVAPKSIHSTSNEEPPKISPASPVVSTPPVRKTSSDTSESISKVEKQLREDYERQVRQLREQHDAKLKDVRAKFEQEEKKETEKIKRAMEDRLRSHKEKVQKDEETETKSLTESHKKRMDELRLKHQSEHDESQTTNDSTRNATTEKNRLELDHKRAMESLKNKFDVELKSEEKRYEMERKRNMDELKEKVQKELDEWHRKEKERKSAMMKNDLEKELVDMRKSLEAEKRAALETEVSKDLERRRQGLIEEHERRLRDLRREHDSELDRIKRKNKDALDDEMKNQHRQTDQIRGDAFDDLRHRQDDALRTAEKQLETFRDELSALTRMTVDIRQTLQPTIAENGENGHHSPGMVVGGKSNGGAKKSRRSEKHANPIKAAVVRSIDDLLQPDTNGEHSSETRSSIGPRLDGLESEDVLDKVTRFLDSQKAVGDQSSDLRHQRRGSGREVHVGANPMVNGSAAPLRNSFVSERMLMDQTRGENAFRSPPKDAVDEYLDRKVNEYFHAQKPISTMNIRDRRSWMPSTTTYQTTRYFNNSRRGFDVESELSSLKRWLNEFEHRLTDNTARHRSGSASTTIRNNERRGAPPLPLEASASRSAPSRIASLFNDEGTVEV